MPELAEVEYFRRQWDPGIGSRVTGVHCNAGKRLFRGIPARALVDALDGAQLAGSEAHGKQMLFRFTGGAWLGVHLGMTGEMRVEAAGFTPGRHDHLVLHQGRRSLVFADPRMFGRVRFHQGTAAPDWWADLPPALLSPGFTLARLEEFVARHGRSPLKALLLDQDGFPGVGNWMADEILWRARLHPRTRAGVLHADGRKTLWREVRAVCAGALKHVTPAYGDPPKSWLFGQRWEPGGHCPRDGRELERATVGGRTTAWCAQCQRP
jgi:formamidopyrimidine-DNA glycosylase